ncbi:hypothetical protein ACQQ2N_06790 [Dokdonella sp. MW10]|uniref:hypothetical protein n=1 Tax=Dokdonella sp. MW10 TaxID=2992926 RepID=UPI003F8148E8
MLLAPFTLADVPATRSPRRTRRAAAKATVPAVRVPAWLVAWAVVGALLLAFVPATRGGGFGGATLPFWLLGAPLVDIAWLTRRRWLAVLRAALARR